MQMIFSEFLPPCWQAGGGGAQSRSVPPASNGLQAHGSQSSRHAAPHTMWQRHDGRANTMSPPPPGHLGHAGSRPGGHASLQQGSRGWLESAHLLQAAPMRSPYPESASPHEALDRHQSSSGLDPLQSAQGALAGGLHTYFALHASAHHLSPSAQHVSDEGSHDRSW